MPIFTLRKALGLLVLLAAPLLASAGPASSDVIKRLSAALDNPAMGIKVESVSTSEIPGMFAVQFENGPVVYATEDGSYFLLGDLYRVNEAGFVNLTEQARDADRLARINAIDESEMIIFAPEGEVRGEVTVFTDVTCFYCQKLHQEVPELNRRGIKVRYLAYPRSGVGTPGYNQLVGAWCSDNPQQTLTALKNKQPVPVKQCEPNPVAAQYELGQQLGVRGTPALVTNTGRLIPGYLAADELVSALGLE